MLRLQSVRESFARMIRSTRDLYICTIVSNWQGESFVLQYVLLELQVAIWLQFGGELQSQLVSCQ